MYNASKQLSEGAPKNISKPNRLKPDKFGSADLKSIKTTHILNKRGQYLKKWLSKQQKHIGGKMNKILLAIVLLCLPCRAIETSDLEQIYSSPLRQ